MTLWDHSKVYSSLDIRGKIDLFARCDWKKKKVLCPRYKLSSLNALDGVRKGMEFLTTTKRCMRNIVKKDVARQRNRHILKNAEATFTFPLHLRKDKCWRWLQISLLLFFRWKQMWSDERGRYVSEFCLFSILLPFMCKMKKSIWMFHEGWCRASAWIYQISNYLHHTKERERLNESAMGKYSLSGEYQGKKISNYLKAEAHARCTSVSWRWNQEDNWRMHWCKERN